MLITGANVVFSNRVAVRDLRITDGKIAGIAEQLAPLPGETVTDAAGNRLLAGFIDSHTHGAVGGVYSDTVSDIDKICEYEAGEGVTTVAATLLSLRFEDFEVDVRHLLPYIKRGTRGAKIGGIHSEGPFLNAVKKGAMNPDNMSLPTPENFMRLYDACEGRLKLITVAPEMPGAVEVIRLARSMGVNVSAGHTNATYDEMVRAIDAGVNRMTHTFNACRAFNHREPGVLGAALTDKRVTCEVICDFIHLHPAAVELVYKLKGSAGMTVISDSEFAAGLAEGRMEIDGLVRIIEGGVAKLEDGTIAGAASSLHHAFRNLLSIGIPVWEVSEMLSLNPAKALGIEKDTGSIEVGKCADLVLVDAENNIVNTFVDGQPIHPIDTI